MLKAGGLTFWSMLRAKAFETTSSEATEEEEYLAAQMSRPRERQ